MEVLKEKTKSICPQCLQELDARVVEDNNNVFLEKECSEHGRFKILIEKDVALYKRIMNKDFIKERIAFEKMALPITNQCNLNCQVCYAPDRGKKDFPLEMLESIIQNFKGSVVKLTGGEATLSSDLPLLIGTVQEERKTCCLVTNGIKLADIEYTNMLKNAGLKRVALAFNGFSDAICEKIYGGKVLKNKLKALKNLKKAGIDVFLSVTLVRGINEKELAKIYRFYLNNRSFIKSLRIRSLSLIGQHLKREPFCISEIIELVSRTSGFEKDELTEPFFQYPRHQLSHLHTSTCRFAINLRSSLAYRLDKKKIRNKRFRAVSVVLESISLFGLINTFKIVIDKIREKKTILDEEIEIRIWPDKQRIDLGEIQHCLTALPKENGRLLPFCYAIIMDERGCNVPHHSMGN